MSSNKDKNYHWGSLEEYYQDESYLDGANKEFDTPPQEKEFSTMERRSFLKVMGASMLMATVGCSRRPVEKIIPYVNKPDEVIQGIPNWYASTCQECSAGCGILIKNREGRPIKLEGNPDHPINQGGLCARGQASLLNLYYPGRLKGPVKNQRGSKNFQEISLSDLDKDLKNQLQKIKEKGGRIALLSGVIHSPSTKKIIQEFLEEYPGSQHIAYEAAVPEEIQRGQELAYGKKVTPNYRFNKARVLVSFGADFLGTWLSPSQFAKQFAAGREVEAGKLSRFVAFESGVSLTGMNADERFAVEGGKEIVVALGLAQELVRKAGSSVDASLAGALKKYSLAQVEKETGVKAEAIQKVARDLWNHRGESLVLGGATRSNYGIALQVVANLINSLLGNDGKTVDAIHVSYQADSNYVDFIRLQSDLQLGRFDALFILNSNPVYQAVELDNLKAALAKVPLVVQFGEQLNETSVYADYVVATPHYLESWNDAHPSVGVYSVAQPALNPLYQTKEFQQCFLDWKGKNQLWRDYIKAYWADHIITGLNQSQAWDETLELGVYLKGTALMPDALQVDFPARDLDLNAVSQILSNRVSFDSGISLSLYPSIGLYDGRSANNAWLQELPDPVSKMTWGNYLAISPALAQEQNLDDGEIVTVETDKGQKVELPVLIQPMLAKNSVMAAIGFGRSLVGDDQMSFGYPGTDFGVIGQDLGADVYPLQKADLASPIWTGIGIKSISRTGKRERLSRTQGHHNIDTKNLKDRHLAKETTYQEYKKDPASGNHKHGHLISLWPEHKYEGYKWGMAIDLNACTGCSACMVSCQAENNIPVVGKKEVVNGRDMHWIRIDRYYKGRPDEIEGVSFQAMLCQHCENAPCETVCPVLATVHNDEGLNQMVYNRCVGTRYCANNCPYKVRRFNYYEYTKAMKQEPLPLALNPDMTVRTRGVMEKCTFCMHRIRFQKDQAKDEGRRVQDGEIKTACEQSCPSNAIVFGDLNDPESRVAKLNKSPRSYKVLEELKVEPRVAYLTQIKNKAPKPGGDSGHH